ncbi:sulfatase family protein [Paenibacillus aquistagni]|uniref:Arylsulfatase A n=1 Tax=Paenibacillus aquistagni TaxID=1852522 RepID=A0A1X7L4B3_9BACL|nr:sulfatase-like hydrolase/transferase [Paenibacillus aquistagni]SMG48728.1 Arylsulfatase A [Paenibacillus aquistagni]
MGKRKHIWLIIADQMRADAMGVENKKVQTPVLDKLAAEGTVFTNAYCASPVCTPSRASIMTGRYPNVHGAWNIGVSLREDEVTLCDSLKELGYRTVGVGKMHFRPQCKTGFTAEAEEVSVRDRGRERDGTYFGFDEHHISEDNMVGEYIEWLRRQDSAVAERFVRDQYRSGDAVRDVWESDIPPHLHQSYWMAEKSIEQIDKHDVEQPLFLWTSFVDPHHPFNPPRAYAEQYTDVDIPIPEAQQGEFKLRPEHLQRQGERGYWPGGGEAHQLDRAHLQRVIRNYYAMITFMDEQIGRINEAWKARGLDDELVIVFTSDHGELLGDHGLMYKGPWFYEGLTRIPMIIRVPEGTDKKVSALMEHVDIAPTLLDIIGAAIPYGIQGVSQRPVVEGLEAAVRTSAITTYDAHDRGIQAQCLRTNRYKLVLFAGETYGELYDLEVDAEERQNVFFDPAYQAAKLQLLELLAERLIQEQDPLPERKALW